MSDLVLKRNDVVREFTTAYDIRADQIFFNEGSAEPYFDFEALSLLVNQLADIPSIVVTQGVADTVTSMISANCEITLPDGKQRSFIGSAALGELRLDGRGTVENWRQALGLAQTRALRTALRSVSFDPVRAHKAAKAGGALQLDLKDPASATCARHT